MCVLVLVLFFLPGGVCYSFFNLIFSPPLSVCVAYSSYFLFFYFIFLCGVGFSLPFWLCPGLDGHQTMRRRRRMTAIWSLSTPPTRNGRLCLSSRHYRSVAKLSNVSCQSTKKRATTTHMCVCVCLCCLCVVEDREPPPLNYFAPKAITCPSFSFLFLPSLTICHILLPLSSNQLTDGPTDRPLFPSCVLLQTTKTFLFCLFKEKID